VEVSLSAARNPVVPAHCEEPEVAAVRAAAPLAEVPRWRSSEEVGAHPRVSEFAANFSPQSLHSKTERSDKAAARGRDSGESAPAWSKEWSLEGRRSLFPTEG